jgi:hypothetical protein
LEAALKLTFGVIVISGSQAAATEVAAPNMIGLLLFILIVLKAKPPPPKTIAT